MFRHPDGDFNEGRGHYVHVDPYDAPSLSMHVKHTVLWKIWPSMLAFTLIATLIVCVDKLVDGVNLGVSSTMLTVLGTVLGFTISYRTSSAYERYIEGRKLWQSVQVATRLASRIIWFHCPNMTATEVPEEKKEQDAVMAILEKKTMLNLLEAYAVALKHYLRGETGIHYEDLYHLVLFLPKYQLPNTTPIRRDDLRGVGRRQASSGAVSTFAGLDEIEEEKAIVNDGSSKEQDQVRFRGKSPSSTLKGTETPFRQPFGPRFPDKRLLPAHNPPPFNFIDEYFPVLAPIRSLFKFGRKRVTALLDAEQAEKDAQKRKRRRHKKEVYTGQNIPVELNLHFSNWISALQSRKTCDPATITQLMNANAALADCLSGLERILTTPLPFQYAIHLKHTAYIYLLFLPFMLIPTLNYLTIPATCIATFIFCGFLEIGDQIEQPLGYDAADLDMGMFAANIRKELHELAAMPPPEPCTFFLSPYNEPLAPSDVRSAPELVESGTTVDDIEESLRKGHEAHSGGTSASAAGLSRSFTEIHRYASRPSNDLHSNRGIAAVTDAGTAIGMSYLPRVKKEDKAVSPQRHDHGAPPHQAVEEV